MYVQCATLECGATIVYAAQHSSTWHNSWTHVMQLLGVCGTSRMHTWRNTQVGVVHHLSGRSATPLRVRCLFSYLGARGVTLAHLTLRHAAAHLFGMCNATLGCTKQLMGTHHNSWACIVAPRCEQHIYYAHSSASPRCAWHN